MQLQIWIIGLALLATVAGCSTPGGGGALHASAPAHVAVVRPGKTPPAADSARRSEAFARYATANSYDLNDQPDAALEQFSLAALADPSNPDLLSELGRRLLQNRDSGKAVDVLQKASVATNAPAAIFALLGRAYLLEKKTNDAVMASETALKKAPNSLIAVTTLADVYFRNRETNELARVLNRATQLALTVAQGSGRWDKMEEQPEIDPEDQKVYFLVQICDLYTKSLPLLKDRFPDVKARVEKILAAARTMPCKSPTLLQHLADNLAAMGKFEQAIEINARLISEYSDLPLFRNYLREKLANMFLQSGDRSNAVQQLEQLVKENPDRYPGIYYALGSLAYESKDYAKAADYFQQAILYSPTLEQAYYDLALMEVNLNKPEEAVKVLRDAKGRFHENFTGEFFLGLAYGKMKNYGESIKHYTAAEIIGDTSEPSRLTYLFYFQFGSVFERNTNYVDAEKYFRKSLKLSPDFTEALNYLGYMWAEQNTNLDEAHEMISKAIKLEPENAAFLDSFGWVLYRQHQFPEALRNLQKAIKLSDEPDPTLYDHLGDVFHAMNQDAKAIEAWKKSMELEPNDAVRKKLTVQGAT